MEKDRQNQPDPVTEPVHSPAKPVLRLKFKLQPIKELPASLPAEERFRCGECHKSFSSRNALGGHVSRVHVQAANRDFPAKRVKSQTKKRNFQLFSGWSFTCGKFTCNVCGKHFSAHGSLFGHMMRCHPDHVRRMDRPADRTKTSTEQQSTVTDGGSSNFVVDDDEIYHPPLMKWLARGQRGRPATKPVVVHSTPPTSSSEEIIVAEKRVFSDEDDGRVENPCDEQSKKIDLSSSHDDQIDDPLEYGGSMTMIMKEKILETPPESDLVGPVGELLPPAASPYKHICNTCGKGFKTPQALGGHRSIHKKLKMRVHNTLEPNANTCKQLEASKVLGDQIQCNGTAGECSHPAGPISTAIGEAPKEKKVIAFDLNELPNDDGEDCAMESDDNIVS